jgi:hypothetical protein
MPMPTSAQGSTFRVTLSCPVWPIKAKALPSSEEFDENYGKHRIPGLLAKNQSKFLHNMNDMYANHLTMTHAT